MTSSKRTATEVSAVAAIAVAVSLAVSGAYIAAAVAALIGVALFIAYERLQIESITLDPELVRELSERSEDEVQDFLDEESSKSEE